MVTEKRLALIHRVIVPDKRSPREYAILVTDTRSIFIHQEKTRRDVWLRGEMKYATEAGSNPSGLQREWPRGRSKRRSHTVGLCLSLYGVWRGYEDQGSPPAT